MAKHTPGPWALDVTPTGWMLISNGADITAQAFDCSDADARLIAAAPDLLAHLTRLIAAIDRLPGNNPLDGLADEARAAIARATGQ